jgi:hypothetical protein
MNLANLATVVSLLLSALLCDSAQTGRGVEQPSDYIIVKDRYSNYDYAYSVRLPEGITGIRSPSPFPNHGFLIQLSDHPKASLSVDASYNAAEWNSFDDAIKAHMDYFKDDTGGEVRLVARAPTVLGGLRAIRFRMKSGISEPNDPEVQEVILAFRKAPGEVGIVYEITLTTVTSRYDQDKRLVASLQRTWRLRKLPK